MAKGIWIEPSKDDPIYNGQFVLSSRKISPESATAEESAEENAKARKVSTGHQQEKNPWAKEATCKKQAPGRLKLVVRPQNLQTSRRVLAPLKGTYFTSQQKGEYKWRKLPG